MQKFQIHSLFLTAEKENIQRFNIKLFLSGPYIVCLSFLQSFSTAAAASHISCVIILRQLNEILI